MIWRRLGLVMAVLMLLVALLAAALWLARARLAAELAQTYFRRHGVTASVQIGTLGLSGVSGRFSLGPAEAPELSAEHVELIFDPLSWTPRLVEVRLVDPVVRARLAADGTVTLPSLQGWIESLPRGEGQSRFVSGDLAVSLKGLRAILATAYGAVEADGDVRLVKNLPVSAALSLKQATLSWPAAKVTLRAATLNFDSAKAQLGAHFSGAVRTGALAMEGIDADLSAADFHWSNAGGGLRISVSAARLFAGAATLTAAGQSAASPRLDLIARRADLSFAGGAAEGAADLDASASGAFNPGAMTALRKRDPALARAIAGNLARLELAASAHLERRGGEMHVALSAPLALRGAKGAVLRVTGLTLQQFGALQQSGAPQQSGWRGAANASLAGGGMPSVTLTSRNFSLADGALNADAALKANFSFAMLRGASLAVAGTLSWRDGHYVFKAGSCGRFSLDAFHPGVRDLARKIQSRICGVAGKPLLAGDGAAWTFAGSARGAEAVAPLATAKLSDGAGLLSFAGRGGDFSGKVSAVSLRATDQAASQRFKSLFAAGDIALAKGAWRGHLALSGAKHEPLGETVFHHDMASGVGAAHLSAPHLAFAPGKLQPVDLSPLLAAFRRADGTMHFEGDIDWTQAAIASRGVLTIDDLAFSTPMGQAHALKTALNFTSLLPPVTAPGQKLAIARIDATLPISALALVFAFDPKAVSVAALNGDIALGHVALGPFTVDLSDPARLSGAAKLSSVALSSLVAASNLGDKIKLEGKISGTVPFTSSAAGFRIVGGHVAADGPGRLSVNRSVWTSGESVNAVQDFAYQALENLAFDQLSADLNSLANGRLQVVFHIKGRSDPPRAQTADIPLADLINGTALQKPVPLPSGTPVDLTLDTSLNFDELLKSYAQAWSNILSPKADAGASQ